MNLDDEKDEKTGIDDFVFVQIEDDEEEIIDEQEEEEIKEVSYNTEEDDDTTEEVDIDEDAVAIYKTLVDKGILDEDDKYDNSWDGLESKIDELPSVIARQIISEAPQATQDLIKYAFSLGNDASIDKLAEFFNVVKGESGISAIEVLESDETAREFLRDQFLKTGRYDEDDIDDHLDILEDKNKLKAKAKGVIDSINENKNKESQRMLAEQEKVQESYQRQRQEHYSSIVNEIENTGWNSSVKNDLKRFLSPNVIQTVNSQIQANPKALVQLLNVYRMYDQESGEFDFSSIEAKGASKETKKIRNNQMKDNFSNTRTNKSTSKKRNVKLFKDDIELTL